MEHFLLSRHSAGNQEIKTDKITPAKYFQPCGRWTLNKVIKIIQGRSGERYEGISCLPTLGWRGSEDYYPGNLSKSRHDRRGGKEEGEESEKVPKVCSKSLDLTLWQRRPTTSTKSWRMNLRLKCVHVRVRVCIPLCCRGKGIFPSAHSLRRRWLMKRH